MATAKSRPARRFASGQSKVKKMRLVNSIRQELPASERGLALKMHLASDFQIHGTFAYVFDGESAFPPHNLPGS
jgi:hypothetical protein